MCGIFFLYGETLDWGQISETIVPMAVKHLKYRGPDGHHVEYGKNFVALHTLLSITGHRTQPCRWRNGWFLYNGELYNDWENYTETYGDADFLRNELNDGGLEALAGLDGEFALIVLDETKGQLHLLSDPFATKPFYYTIENGQVAVASYDFVLTDSGFSQIHQVPANTHMVIDLRSVRICKSEILRPFDFGNQFSDSYETYIDAFQKALTKRAKNVQKPMYVSLSSGHDSGLIAAELDNMGISYAAYGFPYAEVVDVFQERYSRHKALGNPQRIFEFDDIEMKTVNEELLESFPPYYLSVDSENVGYADLDFRNVPGYIAAGFIAKKARENGQLIAMSGQGVDEIVSDYYNEFSNSRRSVFRGDWEKMNGPWLNFYGGWNQIFLGGIERVSGHYGIETRYPFLDHAVVQAFLNLTPDAKKREYKAPISVRLKALDYPLHNKKIGFTGFSDKDSESLSEKRKAS